jgi:hypothetical protein
MLSHDAMTKGFDSCSPSFYGGCQDNIISACFEGGMNGHYRINKLMTGPKSIKFGKDQELPRTFIAEAHQAWPSRQLNL